MFRPLFKGFLKPGKDLEVPELGQKYKNIFVGILVQMKSLEFAFEINWPLRVGRNKGTFGKGKLRPRDRGQASASLKTPQQVCVSFA